MKFTDKRTTQFFELETALHKRRVRNSPEAASALLADDFIEFGSSGRTWNKTAIIESMATETAEQQIEVEDFAIRELARDVVLVTYVVLRPSEPRRIPIRASLRSSIWQLMDGRWQMIFHQGTRIPE